MKECLVSDVMTPSPMTVNQNDVLTRVVGIFNLHSFHHILVVDDNHKLVGVISRTDIDQTKSGASLFHNPKKEEYDEAILRTMRAFDIMTKDIEAISPSDTIHKAYTVFREKLVRSLPVLEDDELVGILTPIDLLDYFFTTEQ